MATPNVGRLRLALIQQDEVAGYKWGLFATNYTVLTSSVWASLTESSFGGYARVTVGSLNAPAIVGGVASYTPVTNPVFGPVSGSAATFYGWFLLDTSDNTLIDAVNFGATTIPVGLTFTLTPTITLDLTA